MLGHVANERSDVGERGGQLLRRLVEGLLEVGTGQRQEVVRIGGRSPEASRQSTDDERIAVVHGRRKADPRPAFADAAHGAGRAIHRRHLVPAPPGAIP